jgi:hypothetical protein
MNANYFLYQRIATATKTMVMIHRMMSLLRFFSFASAMQGSTPQGPLSIQVVFSARIVPAHALAARGSLLINAHVQDSPPLFLGPNVLVRAGMPKSPPFTAPPY